MEKTTRMNVFQIQAKFLIRERIMRSKAQACGRSLVGIAGSYPAMSADVCPL
jgi:hypothetical protein